MDKSEIDAIVRRSEQAAHALMNGDPSQFDAFITQKDDFTIFGPTGGPAPMKGSAEWRKVAPNAAKIFKKGEAKVELFESYCSGNLLVLVLLEHQTVTFEGDSEPQNWSQRVTQVYRREEDDWKIVHRHIDPLVTKRTLDEAKAIARA
ncbi:MAG TPA: nuclear transport factor 2 family protein [Rhizomicrobium sp.]|jgi:ketosteroid isomerase-like protein